MDVKLWFVRLDGWPVLLATVAVVVGLMIVLSVFMTKISGRSVVQNAVLALLGITALGFWLLGLFAVLSRV